MRYLLALVLVGFMAGCASAPATLSPVAAQDFQKTRVIKALDLLRDFAIEGEAATPKVVPTSTARAIVTYHQAALKILDAAGSDWRTVTATSLDAAVAALPAADRAKVAPYAALVHTLLTEVQ